MYIKNELPGLYLILVFQEFRCYFRGVRGVRYRFKGSEDASGGQIFFQKWFSGVNGCLRESNIVLGVTDCFRGQRLFQF